MERTAQYERRQNCERPRAHGESILCGGASRVVDGGRCRTRPLRHSGTPARRERARTA
jgi:hypothetical protein